MDFTVIILYVFLTSREIITDHTVCRWLICGFIWSHYWKQWVHSLISLALAICISFQINHVFLSYLPTYVNSNYLKWADIVFQPLGHLFSLFIFCLIFMPNHNIGKRPIKMACLTSLTVLSIDFKYSMFSYWAHQDCQYCCSIPAFQKNVRVQGQDYTLQLIDTAGQVIQRHLFWWSLL